MANRINTAVVNEYKSRLGANPDFVAVDSNGITVAQFTELRKLARAKGVQVLVVKTTLACIALKDAAQVDALRGVLAGPTAVVYGGAALGPGESMPIVTRLVLDYGKKTGKLAIRGGVFDRKVLTPAQVEKFRDVPDRRTLLAQVLSAVTAPLSGVVGLTQSLLSSPAALADALAKKNALAKEPEKPAV